MKYTFLFILVLFCNVYAFAQQAIGLDPLFGTNGKVFLTNPEASSINGIYALADGKILICGSTDSAGKAHLLVERLNPNGTLDMSFAQNGALIDKLAGEAGASDITVLPDGKILVTGATSSPPPGDGVNFYVMKLLANGTKDVSFGTNGTFIYTLSQNNTNKPNVGRKIKVSPDGGIIVGGTLSNYGTNPGLAIFKLLPNGQLDTQFGIGGKRTFSFSSQDSFGDIALQPDGRILLTAGTWNPHYTVTMRLNANGALDSSFATHGKYIKTFNTNDLAATSILITANKKILVSGYEESSGSGNIFIYRLDSTGALDTSYGNNGFIDYDSGLADEPFSMVELSNKSLIITGVIVPGVNWGDVQLVSCDSLGNLVPNFGTNGTFIYDLNSSNDFPSCSAIQPDGKLLNAGFSDTSFFVTRLFTSDHTGLLQNTKNKTGLKLFPNPATDKVSIVSSNRIRDYDVFNNTGVSIKKATILEDSTLLVKKLPTGIYHLTLFYENDFSETLPLVINR